MPDNRNAHYAAGWNAYLDGVPFSIDAKLAWRDGWLDAKHGGAIARLPAAALEAA